MTKRKKHKRFRQSLAMATNTCPNCLTRTKPGEGHFVQPSLGDRGFYACAAFIYKDGIRGETRPL